MYFRMYLIWITSCLVLRLHPTHALFFPDSLLHFVQSNDVNAIWNLENFAQFFSSHSSWVEFHTLMMASFPSILVDIAWFRLLLHNPVSPISWALISGVTNVLEALISGDINIIEVLISGDTRANHRLQRPTIVTGQHCTNSLHHMVLV